MEKIKYEKPISLDAGQIAAIQGALCQTYGANAMDGCINGFDPNMYSVCLPNGSAASNNCEAGGSAKKTCGSGSNPVWGCYAGAGN